MIIILPTRREKVKIFRLRTGHNHLNHHLHAQFGIGQTDECPCSMGQQTEDHTLQACPTYAAARDNTWPSPRSLENNLYGFTGGSSGNGCIYPRDWVGHLNRDERRRRRSPDLSVPPSKQHTSLIAVTGQVFELLFFVLIDNYRKINILL